MMGTFDKQDSLPHLPVPKLEDTLRRYLRSIRWMLSPQQFIKTKKIVEEFGASDVAKLLQNKIVERSQTIDNWLDDWWQRYVYLAPRESILIISPGALLGHEDIKSFDDQLREATRLVYAQLSFIDMIRREKLPITKIGNTFMCMDQFRCMGFGCRIPGEKEDYIYDYPLDQPKPNHIIVVYKGQFYVIRGTRDDGPLSINEIYQQFKRLVKLANDDDEDKVGYFTTMRRDTWHNVYAQLMQGDPVNKSNLEYIKTSAFIFALDQGFPSADLPLNPQYSLNPDISAACENSLYGCGANINLGSRWFDKKFHLYVDGNGNFGSVIEHSDLDGSTSLPDFAYLISSMKKTFGYTFDGENQTLVDEPKKLQWNLNPELKTTLSQAMTEADKTAKNCMVVAIEFKDYGKEFIKGLRISPDSFMQIALQFAYYRMHCKVPSQYESGSTAMYLKGRTETIRATTDESYEFVKLYMTEDGDENTTNKDKANLFRKAAEAHKKIALESVCGYGWDRHMFGLKVCAMENGMEIPEIFQDEGYVRSSYIDLSTSQMPIAGDYAIPSFGPVADEGYGICYNLRPDSILCTISSFKCGMASASEFATWLEKSLRDIKSLFE